MSNYHILSQADDLKTLETVQHIAIASANNAAGVNYRTALVQYLTQGGVTIGSVVPGIEAAELTALQNGSLYEVQRTYRFSSLNLTNAQKATELDAYYTAQVTQIIGELQRMLQWWGYSRNVV